MTDDDPWRRGAIASRRAPYLIAALHERVYPAMQKPRLCAGAQLHVVRVFP